MAGRTPAEAVTHFVTPIQRTLSCLTSSVVLYSGTKVSDTPHFLRLSGEHVTLGKDGQFALQMRLRYYVVRGEAEQGPWKVQPAAYAYTLKWARDSGETILAYHWHPDGRSPIAFPHLHFYAGAGVAFRDLYTSHIPTGRIAITAVIRFVIEELGAVPLRNDWRQVLDEAQKHVASSQTWA